MKFAPRLTRVAAAALVAAISLVLAVAPTAATPVQGQGGTDLNVDVISTSPQPSSSKSPSTKASAKPSTAKSSTAKPSATKSGSAPSAGPNQPSTVSSAPASPVPGDDTGEQSIGGVLYVSGLTWVYTPSINPVGGTADLRFTVRNVYSQAVDASALLWVSTPFGWPVGIPVEVAVPQLKPGETRVIAAQISGLAQWTMVSAHATFTPPERLGNTNLAPLTRDTVIWFLPWFLLLTTSVIAAEYLRRKHFQRRRSGREGASEGGRE